MSRFTLGAIVLLFAAPAMADTPSFNFFQAGYQAVDLDVGGGQDVDGDGWTLGGSYELSDEWFVYAGYSDTGFDFRVDLTQLQAGVGWKSDISNNTNVFARASYVNAEVDAPGFNSFDESGFGLGVGIRSNVTDLIELYGEISYVDLGSGADGTEIGGGIFFNLKSNFALGLGASTDDDVTSYGATARFYFGK